eukprot:scaffold73018_cov50-Cyclotella_meneghiniana.AAC.2
MSRNESGIAVPNWISSASSHSSYQKTPLKVQLLDQQAMIVFVLLVVLHSHLKALQQYHLETKQHLNSTNFSATQRRHTNLLFSTTVKREEGSRMDSTRQYTELDTKCYSA